VERGSGPKALCRRETYDSGTLASGLLTSPVLAHAPDDGDDLDRLFEEGPGTYRAERIYGTFRRVIPLLEGIIASRAMPSRREAFPRTRG
jgi:hypothetical protein